MKRTELVALLEIVNPALSTNNLIPIMTHFWFTGTHICAYNDNIGLSVPCKTDFACAVPGVPLLGLLKASRFEKVELEFEKDELFVTLGKTDITFATMEKDNFNFEMPKPSDADFEKSVDRAKFFRAIETCLRSVSIDTSVPDQLGVTIIGRGKELQFYSTNNDSMSHAFVPLKEPTQFKRAILHAEFCREMLSLAEAKKPLTLEIHTGKGYALFEGKDGAMLFGKLVEAVQPIPFSKNFDDHFPEGSEKKLIAMPTKLELILERATITSTSNLKPVLMDIEVRDGVAEFRTQAHKIETVDSVTLEKGATNAKLRVDPKLLKSGFAYFSKMFITNDCFLMATDDTYYLVASDKGKH